MCDVINSGKSRIINEGVDVAIITSSEKSDIAMKSSRILVIKGISTAIIVVNTSSLDKDIILEYAKKTCALVFTDREIYDKAQTFINKELAEIELVEEAKTDSIINVTTMAVKNKINNDRSYNTVHYVR